MACLRLSASDNDLDELARRTPISPSFLSTSSPDLLSTYTLSVAALYSQLALAKRQMFIIEAENASLQSDIKDLRSTVRLLSVEISVLRSELKHERDKKNPTHSTCTEKITQLEKRLSEYHTFVRALAEVELHDTNILTCVHARLTEGHNAEKALVEAIQTAARDKDSPWSRIMPVIAGPRISENYHAAVNLILKARKDLHEMEKAARFWKNQCTSYLLPLDTITPPSPRVSEEDGRLNPKGKIQSGLSADASGDCLKGVIMTKSDLDLTREPSSSRAVNPPLLLPIALDHLAHKQSPGPTPIQEGKGSLRSSSSEGSQPVIRISQYNRAHVRQARRNTFHDLVHLDTQVADKRRGFIMPCIKSILLKHTPTSSSVPLISGNPSAGKVSDVAGLVCNDNILVSSTPPSSIRSPSPFAPNMAPNRLDGPHDMALETIQVLSSAERLCATFSSGSLGSLEMSTLSGSSRNTVMESTRTGEMIILEVLSDTLDRALNNRSGTAMPNDKIRLNRSDNMTTKAQTFGSMFAASDSHETSESDSLSSPSDEDGEAFDITKVPPIHQRHAWPKTHSSDGKDPRRQQDSAPSASKGRQTLLNPSTNHVTKPTRRPTPYSPGRILPVCSGTPSTCTTHRLKTSQRQAIQIPPKKGAQRVNASTPPGARLVNTPPRPRPVKEISMLGSAQRSPPPSAVKVVAASTASTRPFYSSKPGLDPKPSPKPMLAKPASSPRIKRPKKQVLPTSPGPQGSPPSHSDLSSEMCSEASITAIDAHTISLHGSRSNNRVESSTQTSDDGTTSQRPRLRVVNKPLGSPSRRSAEAPLALAQHKHAKVPLTRTGLGVVGGLSTACFANGNPTGSRSGMKGGVGRGSRPG